MKYDTKQPKFPVKKKKGKKKKKRKYNHFLSTKVYPRTPTPWTTLHTQQQKSRPFTACQTFSHPKLDCPKQAFKLRAYIYNLLPPALPTIYLSTDEKKKKKEKKKNLYPIPPQISPTSHVRYIYSNSMIHSKNKNTGRKEGSTVLHKVPKIQSKKKKIYNGRFKWRTRKEGGKCNPRASGREIESGICFKETEIGTPRLKRKKIHSIVIMSTYEKDRIVIPNQENT
ncbi:hypothetical protein BDZ91DRAFT_309051 [Kalaharituber pfeilii]|nr:hypothetical protein BDZ91DRAFT_309051 [Kalaharituber pfeilii]